MDYIRRDLVLELADDGYLVGNKDYKDVRRRIESIPAVEVTRLRRGRWINKGTSPYNDMSTVWECSECGMQYQDIGTPGNYCSHCGAKMDGKRNYAKHGVWEPLGHRMGPMKHPWSEDFRCSLCGYEAYTIFDMPPNTCPLCGAQMIVDICEG